MKKWFGTLVCVWLLAGGAKSGLFDQIARMLSSVAQVSESAANVASVVLDGSADFATSTTNAVLSFSTGSVNVARTAWRGVDLVNVNCTKTAGKVIGASAQAVARWFNSSLGKTVTQANFSEPIHLWTALAYSVTAELHTLHAMKDYLDVRGSYWQARGTATHTGFRSFEMEYSFIQVAFAARWANPLWEALNISVLAENVQVTTLVQEFADAVQVQNVTWHIVPDSWTASTDDRFLTFLPLRFTFALLGEMGFMLLGIFLWLMGLCTVPPQQWVILSKEKMRNLTTDGLEWLKRRLSIE